MSESCVICLEKLGCGTTKIGSLVSCGHCFHSECFSRYVDANADEVRTGKLPKCPVCKKKAKKFIPLYISFDSCMPVTESREESESGTTMKSLSSQNNNLKSKVQHLNELSKDQSDLIVNLLPKFDLLEEQLHKATRERDRFKKQLHRVEAENADLISDWNEVELRLESLKTENLDLKYELDQSRVENKRRLLTESKLKKHKKKRKRAESEKSEIERELEECREEKNRVKSENKTLKKALEETEDDLNRLKKRVKKMKRRYTVEGQVMKTDKENCSAIFNHMKKRRLSLLGRKL